MLSIKGFEGFMLAEGSHQSRLTVPDKDIRGSLTETQASGEHLLDLWNVPRAFSSSAQRLPAGRHRAPVALQRLRLGVTNLDRRGSSDEECCEKILCRAEICTWAKSAEVKKHGERLTESTPQKRTSQN